MTSRRTNHVRNPASRDLAIYHEILPPRDQLMSERRCHCLRRAIIRFAAIVSGRLVTIDQPAAASKCAWALRRCVGSFRKRAGASIPIPGGCSLRPVKNRGWGSFKGVCKLAVTRSAVFFSSKCTTNRLAVGLWPDPQRKLTALSQTWHTHQLD